MKAKYSSLTKKQNRYATFDTFTHGEYNRKQIKMTDISDKLRLQQKQVLTENKDNTKEYKAKFRNA